MELLGDRSLLFCWYTIQWTGNLHGARNVGLGFFILQHNNQNLLPLPKHLNNGGYNAY